MEGNEALVTYTKAYHAHMTWYNNKINGCNRKFLNEQAIGDNTYYITVLQGFAMDISIKTTGNKLDYIVYNLYMHMPGNPMPEHENVIKCRNNEHFEYVVMV